MTNESIVMRIQAGETVLLDRLIEENQGLIWTVARQYIPQAQINRALDVDDLLQAATLGMIEAVPAWDEGRGPFVTIAMFYMRRNVREALGIHTSKERIENMGTASLDAVVGEEGDTPLVDLLPDEMATNPAQAAIEADMKRIVRAAVDALPKAHRRAIQHRLYGGAARGSTREQTAALRALARNKALRWLWAEYESAPYHHRSIEVWKHTNTSTTEAAVIERERLRERMALHAGGIERV